MEKLNSGIGIFHPKKIFVENDAVNLPIIRNILSKLPNVPVEYIDDYRNI